MIRKSLIAFAVLTLLVSTVEARSSMMIQRGGLGFLFPDHNSFSNPGQFSTAHGSALELGYLTQSNGGQTTANPSFVYGNGAFGLGLKADRTGTSITETGAFTDTATAGLGFSAMKERMTIGASFSRVFTGTPVGDGTISATLTLQGARRMGAVFGVGYQRILGLNTHSATFGFGYGFMSSNSVEANIQFNNLDDANDFTASGYFNLGRDWFYMGAGYSFAKLAEVHSVAGRVGFVFGRVDISGLVQAPFTSGGTLTYGGSLRAAF